MTIEDFYTKVSELAEARRPFFFLVDYEREQPLFLPLEEENRLGIRFQYGQTTNASCQPTGRVGELHPDPMTLEEYAVGFGILERALKSGEIDLVNYTCRTPIHPEQTLEEMYEAVTAKYKVLVPGVCLSFSPERFVRITSDGVITSHPMKGTIPISVPNAREVIINDPKEQREHAHIVSLTKAELGAVGSDVDVPRYRYIEEVHTKEGGLLQVSSEVRAQLPSDWRAQLGTILSKLIPPGSITGTPKERVMELIQEAEQNRRGYYSGISGYYDGDELETAVMIRFIEETPDGRHYFHSGGGVTADSTCEREYREMIDKIYLPVE